jgi:23S rRNA pseudouridine2604 synthase
MEEQIRLAKYFTDCGVLSRRAAEEEIKKGRVKVNGTIAELGQKITPGKDVVEYAGKKIMPPKQAGKVYLMLNKPRGFVTTMSDEKGRPTVAELTRSAGTRVYPVGRLDKDSEGLLLMTSDGDIVNRLLRAAGGHEKEYEVRIDRPVTPEFVQQMSRGVAILDTVTLPCRVRRTGERSFNIILVQGLNRQIRRMCEALGANVTHLRRVRIMNLRLGRLQPGQWRELTEAELAALMERL